MSKKTILVVEDEVVIAMDLQNILIDLGYNVPEILTSGQAAVERALAIRPDLILMDIHLGDKIDGIDATTRIVQELDVPVIYLTAYADETTVKRASQTSPFGYILKPFVTRELRASIEIALHKHQCEQLVKENQRWLLAVLNSIGEGVAASNAQGQIKFMNPVAEVLTNWTQSEAIGMPCDEVLQFIDELSRESLENPLLDVMRYNRAVYMLENILLVARGGQETPVSDSAAPIRDAQGSIEGAVIVFRDVTEQKQMKAQIEHNALHDALTQLPNRTLFLNRLQQSVERTRRLPDCGFVVMLLDLDRFKIINDTFGHIMGDRLLVEVAPRLQACLRSLDIVARFGGDEFAILLEDVTDIAIACRTAERILEDFKQPINLDGHEFLITASIGIVLHDGIPKPVAELIQNADIAMYRAKQQGRGCYQVFDAEMHRQAMETMQLEHALRQVIARNELRVHYQPIVSLATGKITSLEALVRWQTPEGGLIHPIQFIAIAEETGLITEIDRWVLSESCRQLKHWQTLGNQICLITEGEAKCVPHAVPNLSITVNANLSRTQFHQESLVESYTRILRENEIDGRFVKLEVTESVLIDNHENAVDTLSRLKDLGIHICLDDFGTGYSSLSYLHKFPIDIVKIDRSFIQGLEADAEKLEIVRAIIALCHNLQIEVVAEGIETKEQAAILQDLGCEYGQGYLFARAMTGEAITQLLSAPN